MLSARITYSLLNGHHVQCVEQIRLSRVILCLSRLTNKLLSSGSLICCLLCNPSHDGIELTVKKLSRTAYFILLCRYFRRPLDRDYRITDIIHGTVYDVSYDTYDAAGNIKSITNNLSSAHNQSFTYDALGRLDEASGVYGTPDYRYDDNGNRTQLIDGIETTTYRYYPGSNRLETADDGSSLQTYRYEANGHLTDNGVYGFTYGDHNRLSEVTAGGVPLATYTYNGRGERVRKVGLEITDYSYDQAGQLLAERDENGATRTEYLYLEGQPIAIIEPDVRIGTDLIMTEVTPSVSTVYTGQSMTVTNTLKNQGASPTESWTWAGVYLSTDATVTTADTYLGYWRNGSLGAGAEETNATIVTIPASQVPATYYLGVITDYTDQQTETDETNNTLVATGTLAVTNP